MTSDASNHGTPDDQRLLSGKRRAARKRRSVAVKCIGPAGKCFAGRTVDISRGGMLLDITDPEFQPLEESSDLIPFAARVATQFPDGMDVNFGDGAVQVHADVVRLVSKPGKTVGTLLGCKFHPPLTEFDCRLLGVDAGLDETPAPATAITKDVGHETAKAPVKREAAASAAPAPLLRGNDELRALIGVDLNKWQEDADEGPVAKAKITTMSRDAMGGSEMAALAKPTASKPEKPAPAPKPSSAPKIDETDIAAMKKSKPPPGSRQPALSTWAGEGSVVVHLFPANAPLHGPRFMGKLVNLRVRTALVEMPVPADESDPAAWAAALGVSARMVAMHDGRVLWETHARVMHLCAADTAGWARATLLAVKAPPLYARRLLGLTPVHV